MRHEEAVEFIQKNVKQIPGIWLDLGAGSGIFSKALAELLPPESKIYAVDRDRNVLNVSYPNSFNKIIRIQADFYKLPELPQFDGILMANALHFVKSPIPFLQKILEKLHSKGSFILIEYDIETSNPWVPFPISLRKWQEISSAVGLSAPRVFNERVSSYGQGTMYAAINYLDSNLTDKN